MLSRGSLPEADKNHLYKRSINGSALHSKGPRAATFNLGLKRCHSRRVFSLHPQYSATLCCCSVCIQVGIPADRAQTTERPVRIQAANGIARIRSDHPWLQILGRQRRGVIVSVFLFENCIQMDLAATLFTTEAPKVPPHGFLPSFWSHFPMQNNKNSFVGFDPCIGNFAEEYTAN